MNTGQTMLVIAAFAVLSTITLAINSTLISTVSMGIEMESSLNALSIAQTMLDEILLKDFDENTTNNKRVFTYAGMTVTASLGPDGMSEAVSGLDEAQLARTRFDDVDDYHLYRRRVWNERLGWFTITDSVFYVNELSPDTKVSNPTWHKRILVTVTSPTMPKDLNGNPIPYQLTDLSIYRRYY
jgi:hypothetical protein